MLTKTIEYLRLFPMLDVSSSEMRDAICDALGTIDRRIADLETATGTEKPSATPARLPSTFPKNILDPKSWDDEPSLQRIMVLMSHQVGLYENKDGDWERGYCQAMRIIYRWIEELQEEQ